MHVLFAFALVAAVTTFWALIVVTRPGRASLTPAAAMWLGRAGTIVVAIASLGVLVFGVWLALYLDDYELWDGWILGALVLWVVGVGAGQRAGALFRRAAENPGEAVALRRSGVQLEVAASAAVVLILVLMIFKPGA